MTMNPRPKLPAVVSISTIPALPERPKLRHVTVITPFQPAKKSATIQSGTTR